MTTTKTLCTCKQARLCSRKSLTVFRGLRNGTFTIFSSDHCPFRYDHPHGKPSGVIESSPRLHHLHLECDDTKSQVEEREQGKFRYIPNGIPGVETRLPLLYTGGICTGKTSPSKFVEVTSTNPAKLVSAQTHGRGSAHRYQYGLYPRKGALLPGSDADIVIVSGSCDTQLIVQWHSDSSFEPFTLTNAKLHHNVDCKS